MVKPGLPTTADLYVLPQESTPVKRSVFVDKVDASFCLGCHSNKKRYILRQQNISLAIKTIDMVTQNEDIHKQPGDTVCIRSKQ